MSGKQWPTLILLIEGGPDDGLVVNEPLGQGAEPPEELLSAHDPLGGRYLRSPEPSGRWTWTYRWVVGSRSSLEP